jgi:hypothetical protein
MRRLHSRSLSPPVICHDCVSLRCATDDRLVSLITKAMFASISDGTSPLERFQERFKPMHGELKLVLARFLLPLPADSRTWMLFCVRDRYEPSCLWSLWFLGIFRVLRVLKEIHG